MDTEDTVPVFGFILIAIFAVPIIWGLCAFGKSYGVWAASKAGQAELAQAESNRKIKILEAQAQEESAKHYAASEITRAKGVAEANKIIGDSLKSNESYLRYLWIQGLQTNQMQVIYLPTEAGLPILEASRFPNSKCHKND